MYPLVLADGATEDVALARVIAGLFDEPFGVADTFCRDQNALGIHAGEDVAEALAFLADATFRGNAHVFKKHFAGIVVHHRADRPDGQALIQNRTHVDEKCGESLCLLAHLIARRGTCEQHHQVGMLGAARPNFLAVDDVFIALALGECAQRGRVGAARRLGDAEGLQPKLAGGDLRQVSLLLRRRAVPQDGAHRVKLGMARRAVAAARLYGLEDGGRGGEAEAGAAELFGNEDGKEA